MYITITILYIIRHLVSCLKHIVSETGFFLHRQAEPTQFGPIDIVSLCLQIVVFQIKNRTMDDIQNCDSYINISLSQTYR
jgi:hypothetical protein